MIIYAVLDDSLSDSSPLGDADETFIWREDAERFIEEVRGDEPELASYLRIEEPELEAGRRYEGPCGEAVTCAQPLYPCETVAFE